MPLTAALVGNTHGSKLTQMTSALKRRTRWGRWSQTCKTSKRWKCQIVDHPFSKWGLVIECEGKFGPTTTEIVAALKGIGKEPLPDYPSKGIVAHVMFYCYFFTLCICIAQSGSTVGVHAYQVCTV